MSVTPLPHVADADGLSDDVSDTARDTPEVRLPRPDEVLSWWLRVMGELGRAPFTVYRVRKLLTIMAQLPDHLEALTNALDRTADTLEVQLDQVDARLQALQSSFDAVDGHLGHVDDTVGELSKNITNLIGAIPGARRALRNTAR